MGLLEVFRSHKPTTRKAQLAPLYLITSENGVLVGTLQELVEYLPTYAVSNPLKLAQFDKSAR